MTREEWLSLKARRIGQAVEAIVSAEPDEIQWARIDIHGFKIARLGKPIRRRCLWCPKGARRPITHVVVSNGLAMASGCEWHIYNHYGGSR